MKIIKSLRQSQGISQQKLADLLGVSRSTVAMWETDATQPDHGLTVKIAEYFGVTTDYLLGVSGDKTPLEPKESDIDEEKLKFALFGGDGEITDEMFDEVKRYAQFIKERKKNGGA